MKADRDALDADRQKLLEGGLGRWFAWKTPKVSKTVGPFDPAPFLEFNTQRQKTIDEFKAKLQDYSNEEIAMILGPRNTRPPSPKQHRLRVDPGPMARIPRGDPPDRIDRLKSEWSGFASSRRDALRSAEPEWFAAGFGHPDHLANFEYWSRMPDYTMAETTCLSIGIEPDGFSERRLKELRRDKKFKDCGVLNFLVQRYEQLRRRFDPADHGWRVKPAKFLDWVDHFEIEVHGDFVDHLRRYHGRDKAVTAREANKPSSDRREVDSIAKLFTAMAIEYYGYDPTAARSPIPREITDMAANLGLSISDETVRKYLRIGAKAIPDDWKPNGD
ncbi:hypothetical protein [Jannaschia ovalis]|uniref:Uncharacterized protein n=1 Tax=Jannaschia ovalis TaxID=3038773 RepID=A0ABY8LDD7_9RHOB|nr:hypothetical protein [Jannaschia sp. GRR-S6-38]WGH78617.1 hypothetical protein P8627_16640 [Jannaschia sp. GRR-S6-38]